MNRVFLNVDEAACFLRISKSTVYKKVMRKELPFHKLGSRTLFDQAELGQYILNGGIPPNPMPLDEFEFLRLPALAS
jgi:excisionase family DNA binding protein